MRRNRFCTFVLMVAFLQSTFAWGGVPPAEGFSGIVSKLAPAVVNISSEYRLRMENQGLCANPAILEEFSEFCERLKPFFRNKNPGKKYGTSLGSGFLISEDGLIVTNYHVVANADKIKVVLSQCAEACQQYEAQVIGYDKKTDLAVLKISGVKGLPYLQFGDSYKMKPGDWVIAVGNPFGLGGSVSAGIVSAISREIGLSQNSDFIQTDVVLNSGNSGGPLCNVDGEVIGVNTAALYSNGGSVGIGFAVPSDVVKPVVEALARGEQIQRGWIGIVIQEITNETKDSLGGDIFGVLVASVDKDGPAYKAGVKVGDVITAVNGEKMSGARRLVREVSSRKVGDTVTVSVVRDALKSKESVALKVKIEKMPQKHAEGVSQLEVIGLVLSNLTDTLRNSFGLGVSIDGVVVLAVDPDKETFLKAGDVIVGIGTKRQVATVQEFKRHVDEARKNGQKSLLVLINRGKQTIFAAVGLDD